MKRAIIFITLLLYNFVLLGKTKQIVSTSQIYFNKGASVIEQDLLNNTENINYLITLLNKINRDSLSTITKITIDSYSSPEGDRLLNKRLSEERANSVVDYLLSNTSIDKSVIVSNSFGADWESLLDLVNSSDMMFKDEVANIIVNVPEETRVRVNPNDRWFTVVDSRNKHLMDLKEGVPYNYMIKNFHPYLRQASIVTLYYNSTIPIIETPLIDSLSNNQRVRSLIGDKDVIDMSYLSQQSNSTEEIIKPLVAIKTNLLFDVASLINIELEIPIGNNWSIAGEWVFPWWSSCGDNSNKYSKRNTLQLLNGNVEGRYWFRDVYGNKPVMTGWFTGVYAGGGLYDLEYNTKGYQGDFLLSLGISGGYAHTINKSGNLRMEYSLGVGYLESNYNYYQEHYGSNNLWHTIKKESGNYKWVGPTRAKISLVWLLNKKVKIRR